MDFFPHDRVVSPGVVHYGFRECKAEAKDNV